MTVPAQTPINSYTYAGSSTFPYSFLLLKASDLLVTVDGATKTLGVDYTVSGVGVQAGGTVTYLGALTAGQQISLYRQTTLSRATDYQTLGDFLANDVNGDFDRLWMALQEQNRASGQTLRVPETAGVPSLPAVSTRAGKFLAFDLLGNPMVLPSSGSDTTYLVAIAPDNSASINAAIALLAAAGGGTLKLQPGLTYNHSSTITLQSNVTLDLNSSALNYTGNAQQLTSATTGYLYKAAVKNGVLNCGTAATKLLELRSAYQCAFDDLTLKSNSLTVTLIDLLCNSSGTTNPDGNWNAVFSGFRNILADGTCGRYIRMFGNGSVGVVNQPVTLNNFFNVQQRGNSAIYGIDFAQACDNNYFAGETRIQCASSGGVGVIHNSVNPNNNLGVYANNFDTLAVDTFNVGALNRTGMVLNFTKDVVVNLFFQGPIAENGQLSVSQYCYNYEINVAEAGPAGGASTNYNYKHVVGYNMGLGLGQALPGVTLRVGGNTTGASEQDAVLAVSVPDTTLTGTAAGVTAYVQTLAAAYTAQFAVGFQAGPHIKGAGSTITGGYGFYAADSGAGANNYGFYSNMASSGTSKWAFYNGGGAPSIFGAGDVNNSFAATAHGTVDTTGTNDSSTAIQNAINAAAAAGGGVVTLPPGAIKISTGLTISTSGVVLEGAGAQTFHDGGSITYPTRLVWGGAANGTMVTYTTNSPSTTSMTSGVGLRNVVLDGNASGGTGLLVQSVRASKFENVYVKDCTQQAYSITSLVRAGASEATDTQDNIFSRCNYRLISVAGVQSANGYLITTPTPGSNGANPSFNRFEYCTGHVYNGVGIIIGAADNNTFQGCRVFRTNGTANFALSIRGGDGNIFHDFSAPGANSIEIRGTASGYWQNPVGTSFFNLDDTNGTTYPIFDAGCRAQVQFSVGGFRRIWSYQMAMADSSANAQAAGQALTTETLRIDNRSNNHARLYDGTNEYGMSINASGHLSLFAVSVPGGSGIQLGSGAAFKVGMCGATPVSQSTGWGTPTGASITTNFPGATATLVQTSQTLASLLTYLKSRGDIGA